MTSPQPDKARLHGNARIAAMQNPLDRVLYHPLAARLARMLAKTPVTPNMVSVASGMMVVLAGIAYVQPGWPGTALAGLALHMSWHVLDGADGDLARLTGRSSPTGEIIDGIADYASHFILYTMLIVSVIPVAGWIAPVLGVAAGLSRIVQASFHEAQRRQYLCWAYDVPWLRTRNAASSRLGALGAAYLSVAGWLAPGDAAIDRALADPDQREALREKLIALGPAPFAGSSLLGANYRTIALGLSMLAGSPLWYFLYEATALNLVLAQGVWRSRRAYAALSTRR
ncbi:MAG: CDP-alcohol phosphatidyltransferase family protein [Sphingomonadaceae bacterium]|nr:CDP-alcohol phosphatidyltransferase family protein [Sphingomonadaceae bacterium]